MTQYGSLPVSCRKSRHVETLHATSLHASLNRIDLQGYVSDTKVWISIPASVISSSNAARREGFLFFRQKSPRL